MVFSSLTFLFVFLPVVFAAYFLLPKSFRNYVLLAASLFFYAWGEPVYIILMVLSILFNYAVGCEMESKDDNPSARKKCLLFALAVNIGLLALFKYCFFLHLALPIGISFYTFQALSYVIDLYIGKIKAQKNLFTFALYICMFPQLIAGPIVRYIDVEKQLKNRTVTFEGFGAGARLFIIGLAKKVLLANVLSVAVDLAYNNAAANSVPPEVLRAGAPELAEGRYALVLANILAQPLKVLAPLLCAHVAAGGALVLAGVLARQVEELQQAYAPYVSLQVADEEDGWALLVAQRAEGEGA